MMNAQALITRLGLEPLPGEGGFYRETYRSPERIAAAALPARYNADKSLGTAIYYLLTPDAFSALHRLRTDEIYHFYLGDPVTMLQLHPDGTSRTLVLGPDLRAGQELQCAVPRGVWHGTHLNRGGEFALLGTTMAPGFDFEDRELGNRDDLSRLYPEQQEPIRRHRSRRRSSRP
jgi:predicted cupin superfamily sugar epimerase